MSSVGFIGNVVPLGLVAKRIVVIGGAVFEHGGLVLGHRDRIGALHDWSMEVEIGA